MHWILAVAALLAQPPQTAPIGEHPPLVRVQEGDRCGYIDRTGHYVIPARYDGAGDFDEPGLAAVRLGKRYAYIDTGGRTVFTLPAGLTGEGFGGDAYAVIAGPRGKGFVDRTGRIAIPPRYRDVERFEGRDATVVEIGRDHALIDRNGRLVIPVLRTGFISHVAENVFAIHDLRAKTIRHVDARGNPVDYRAPVDWAATLTGPFEVLGIGRDTGYVFAYPPGAHNDGPAGMIDRQGRWTIPPVYDDMNLGEGDDETRFILVRRGPKWGFIDIDDKVVIPLEFDALFGFDGAYAQAAIGEKWGLIDRRGDWVLQPGYDAVEALSPGFAAVRFDNRYGVVDFAGRWVIAPRFQAVARCHPHGKTDKLS